jgi:hypothetical protein
MEANVVYLESRLAELIEPAIIIDKSRLWYKNKTFDLCKTPSYHKLFLAFYKDPERLIPIAQLQKEIYGISAFGSHRYLDSKKNSLIKIICRARKEAYEALGCEAEISILPYDHNLKGWRLYCRKDIFFKTRVHEILHILHHQRGVDLPQP